MKDITLREHFRPYFKDKIFRNPYYKNELAKKRMINTDIQFLTYDQYIGIQLSGADILTVRDCIDQFDEDWDRYMKYSFSLDVI